MKNFFLIIITAFTLFSCARVGSPIGGDKDTIPPKVIAYNIDTSRVNISKDLRELRIYFDEYITLKDVNKNLIISPSLKLKKILPTSIANKYILLQWDEPLKENTTYNFNFGNAIADLNEGNILPYYTFAFSTGEKLDDLYISGDVFDGLKPKKDNQNTIPNNNNKNNFVVGLFPEKDSLNYSEKPYYITKADETGYFELNYLSPGTYRILAFDDENQNSILDIGKEAVAFQKEALVLEQSISGKQLLVFPTKKQLRYKEIKERDGGLMMIFEGNPQTVEVTANSEKLKEYKVLHTPKSDTVNIWFDAEKQNIGSPQSENLKFSYKAEHLKGEASIFYRPNPKAEMSISNLMGGTIPPNRDLEITANYPIEQLETTRWTLNIDSLTTQPFTAEISSENKFKIKIKSNFEVGKKYTLTVPKETVKSFYATIPKTYQFNFQIDKEENYGSFTLSIEEKPDAKFWVQFLDEQQRVQISKFTNDKTLNFTEIKPGIYYLRILVDNNGNGFWDEADIQKQTYAEEVYWFPKKIEIRPLWENKETWHLKSNSTETPIQIIPKEEAESAEILTE